MPPRTRASTASDELNHISLLPFQHEIETIEDTEAYTFNRSADKMIRCEIGSRDAMQRPARCGEVGRTLPIEKRKKYETVTPWGYCFKRIFDGGNSLTENL